VRVSFVTRLQRLPGDTLVVLDGNARVASFFDASGAYVDRIAYPRLHRRRAATHQRSAARRTLARYDPRTVGPGRKSMARSDAIRLPSCTSRQRLCRHPTRTASTHVALVPDSEAFDVLVTYNGETAPDVEPLRLGRSTVFTTDGAQLLLGTNEQFELRRLQGATLQQLIRLDVPAEPAPPDAGQRVIAWARSVDCPRASPEVRAEFEALSRNWRFATTLPFYETLRFGEDGTLWASAATILPTDARRYVVFDTLGRAIARIELPPRIEPFRVSSDRILGVFTDEDDVPHVRVWRVRATP
jgi:hypothetical protein